MRRNLRLAGQTAFSLRLFRVLASDRSAYRSAKNLCFSPLSIQVMLSLVAEGAVGRSLQTLNRVVAGGADLSALGSHVVDHLLAHKWRGGPRLSAANAFWYHRDKDINFKFYSNVINSFHASAGSIDFNDDVLEIVDYLNSSMPCSTEADFFQHAPDYFRRIVIASRLYFGGELTPNFDPSSTHDDKFSLPDGSSVVVPFMTNKSRQLVLEYPDFKVLRLPYKRGKDPRRFSFYILLPKRKTGLHTLERAVSSNPDFIDRLIPTQRVEMRQFKVPRLRLCHHFEASNQLKKLGLNFLFDKDKFGLSGMFESPSDVSKLDAPQFFHTSNLDFHEYGTKAVAAAKATIVDSIEQCDFVANHPFLFFIREENSKALVLIGHVLNPLAL